MGVSINYWKSRFQKVASVRSI